MVYFDKITLHCVRCFMKTRLRDLREDNDLTQEECAKIAFISKKSYIRYEKGERVPPIDTMKTLAEYYNVSLDYLVERTDKKEINK